jgi:predicted Zn-dependent peptidase
MKRCSLLALTLAMLACHPPASPNEPAPLGPPPSSSADERAGILAASELPPLLDAPLPDDAMGVTIHRLSNGMTVYVSPNREQPRVSAWIVVRTGSRNDPPDSTGLAHYLEHMLFKGSDELGTLDLAAEQPHLDAIAGLYAELRGADDARRAAIFAEIDRHTQATAAHAIPNELDRVYASLGVRGVNAFTSDEITAYIADVPSNRLDAWARVEGERFGDPVFRLFYPELEAVYEEKNLSLDSPGDRVWEALLLALFPTHPYGTQPTIGTSEHLKTPAYGDMVEYFADWYAPNNMAIVLAGDVEAAEVVPLLERSFGRLEPRALPEPAPASIAPLAGRSVREVVTDAEQTLTLAWPGVPLRHADEPALVVLDALLDNSRTGLLNLELELEQKVQDAGSWVSFLREGGYVGMRATLLQGQTHAEVEALLLGVAAKLAAGEFSDAELDTVKLHLDIDDKWRAESNGSRVSKMANAFIARRSWAETLERDARLRAVTRDDVIRVANTYLGPNYVVVERKSGKSELPDISKPSITPIPLDNTRQSSFARDVLAMPATLLEPQWLREGQHFTRSELPGGPLIAAHNPRNDLFSLAWSFDRGHRNTPMLCVAFDLLERSGSGKRSAAELQRQLYALGTTVDVWCDADEVEIRVSGIDRNLEQSVDLVEGWLRAPNFDDATLTGLRTTLLSEREDRLDDPDELGGLLASYAQLGKQAPALLEPSNAALRRASGKSLTKLLTSFPDQRHRTTYFGPRSAEQVASLVTLGHDHRALEPRADRRFRADQGTTIYFLHDEVAKSSISIALPQGQQPREQRPYALYYNQVLGGSMAGLIFQEIREARGLAYYAYAYVSTGGRPGDEWALQGGLGTQADKTRDALALWLELLRTRELDRARLPAARDALDASYRSSRVDPRWVAGWVESWQLLGEPEDPRPWEWQQIQAIEPDALARFAAGYAKLPVLISIVGDRSKVDLDGIAALGKLVEVERDELVSWGAF